MQTIENQFYEKFDEYVDRTNCDSTLQLAMKYSFDSQGKLFRPKLFWAMLDDLQVEERHLEIAIAIEMIHTYSLIHDDLPAMDNDDYRRGRLTCHKVYGDDIAILVGDALLTQAFDIIARAELDADVIVQLIRAVTTAAGITGMIDGQVRDVKNESDPALTLDTLKLIHEKKTAMMIELPILAAQIIAGKKDDVSLNGARELGIFYQIQDDYLDTYGDFEKMGKAQGADAAKVTYTTLYTKQNLEAYIKQLGANVLKAYERYPMTRQLIEKIIKREG